MMAMLQNSVIAYSRFLSELRFLFLGFYQHQTKLNRGKVYGLPGGYDIRKSTPMRTIVYSQVKGFPDTNEVRTMVI